MKTRTAAGPVALFLASIAFPAATFADAIDEFVASYMQQHPVPVSTTLSRDRWQHGTAMVRRAIRPGRAESPRFPSPCDGWR